MSTKLQPWLIWLTATSFVFFQFLLQTSTSVMIPAFMQDFHINALQVGILSSSYFYSYLTMQLPSAMLVDRFGARLVLSSGIIICAIACWLFAHADNFYTAQISRILMGLGSSPVISATFALVARWFPSARFALIIGLTDTLGMTGGIAGQAYLAHWVKDIGWRHTMSGCFIMAIIITLLISLIVRDKIQPISAAEVVNNPLKKLGNIIRSPQIWLNGIYVAFVWGVAIGFTGLWSVPFLQTQYQLPLTLAASASSMVFAGIAVATPIIGWLADISLKSRRILMFACTAVGLATLSMALYVPHLSLPLLFTLLFLFGGSTGSYIISFAIVRERTSAESRATAMGFTNMMSIAIGSPILQPLIGYLLIDKANSHFTAAVTHFTAGNFKLAFIILPIGLAIALMSLGFIKLQRLS